MKREQAGISTSDLKLVSGDVTRKRLGRKFDWVVLLFNTMLAFPTLEEQDALLRNVVRHLKPGGRFWVDIFQPNLSLSRGQGRKTSIRWFFMFRN